jgi:haloalkane dehalogenase
MTTPHETKHAHILGHEMAFVDEETGDLFRAFRTEGVGEKMVLEDNFFIDKVLGETAVARPLPPDVLAHYNSYYPTPESRKPILAWTRQVPIANEPADVVEKVKAYSEWLMTSHTPKLLLYAEPGLLVPAQAVEWLEQHVNNLTTEFIGQGVHFVQEDNPEGITRAIQSWLKHH